MTRNNSLDLLRIVSCFTVILLHINFYYFQNIYMSPSTSKTFLVEHFINIITRFSVPCFIMISGAFNLKNSKNSDFKYFYKKSFIKVFLPLLFLNFVLSLIFLTQHNYSFSELFMNFYRCSFYNTWFMYMLFFIYMLTPFIIIIKNNVSKKCFYWISIVLMIWAFISQATTVYSNSFSSGLTISYLGYYLIGNVIYEKSLSLKSKNIIPIVISILMILITFLYRYFVKIDYRYSVDPYTNFFSPTIIIYSICIFYIFCNINIKFNLYNIANYTFYIYLFHTVVYLGIFKYLNFLITKNQFINIFVVTSLTFIISLLLSVGFKWFWNRYIVVKKA